MSKKQNTLILGAVYILTFQDFLRAIADGNKTAFILQAIQEYRQSDLFLRAEEATEYYARRNVAILERMSFLERKGVHMPVKFHKLANGFYQDLIKQWVFYTLADGLTLAPEKKARLGRRFENNLMTYGVIPACNAGVSWGFWDNDHIIFFTALEAFGLFDERTNDLRALIRFWQIDEDKPMFVELYEVGGVTEFATDQNGTALAETIPQRPYRTRIFRDSISEFVVGSEVYSELPIYPLYVNELEESEFNDGLKSYIDAYDFISSDQVDQITTSEGIHWIIKNLGGENFQSAFEMLQTKLYPVDDNAGTDIASHVVEAPYEAKQATLDFLENRIYADFLMPNARQYGRVAVTATEIKDANKRLDIKADILEWQVCDFVENILNLIGVPFEQDEVKFKRRSTINDSEMINNISTMLSDQYIDAEAALTLNPLISDKDKDNILARLALAEQEQAEDDFEMEQDEAEQELEV